ncbi:MAG TPA: pyrroline-5-carboxylate reductase [Acidimicrobiales bacterium]
MTTRLAIFGGGNMGTALVGGLLASKWAKPAELAVVEVSAERRQYLSERFPGLAVRAGLTRPAEAALIAVKPGEVATVCRAVAAAKAERVLSIAAGVPTAVIEDALGTKAVVVRAMPNTPALVGAGAAAICAGRRATEADLEWAASILTAVGTVVRVPEALLDAVTGLSGSGPAYVFLLAEALVDAGVLVGLPRATSRDLVVQLLVGSSKLLAESGDSPEVLRQGVTSPAGTTAAGLLALERGGFRAAVLEAVAAATQRSRDLGGPGPVGHTP